MFHQGTVNYVMIYQVLMTRKQLCNRREWWQTDGLSLCMHCDLH